MVKKGAEEGVWTRGSFGKDPPLMGHTNPNTFLQKSVGSFICKALYIEDLTAVVGLFRGGVKIVGQIV